MEVENLKPQDRQKLSPVGERFFKFIEFDDQESLVCEIRKHPIGLFFIYFVGFAIAATLSFIFGFIGFSDVVLDVLEEAGVQLSGLSSAVVAIGGMLIILVLAAMMIQSVLYTSNVIFVTNEKIAQILYISLFNRKISQLSIGDVQDVTVTQKGVLAHLFNYGTLVIETAGEQQNYTFTYIPKPYYYSKLIVAAHERSVVKYGN